MSDASQPKVFSHILIPLENSAADETILRQVRPLAKLTGARLTLIHVADGFMARNQNNLAESREMAEDREYLTDRVHELTGEGFTVESVLECGEPAARIVAFATEKKCDLIAMATHGHRGLSDIVLGSVANSVRHQTDIPVLLARVAMAGKKKSE
ncbi:hypothetical protein BH09SUM1_BH09SUM1_11390 [soil metagenome]